MIVDGPAHIVGLGNIGSPQPAVQRQQLFRRVNIEPVGVCVALPDAVQGGGKGRGGNDPGKGLVVRFRQRGCGGFEITEAFPEIGVPQRGGKGQAVTAAEAGSAEAVHQSGDAVLPLGVRHAGGVVTDGAEEPIRQIAGGSLLRCRNRMVGQLKDRAVHTYAPFWQCCRINSPREMPQPERQTRASLSKSR